MANATPVQRKLDKKGLDEVAAMREALEVVASPEDSHLQEHASAALKTSKQVMVYASAVRVDH
jgi:hypothetical protein